MKSHRTATLLISALIGAFYWWVLIHVWGMHSVDSSLNQWLLANVPPRDHLAFFRVVSYSQDVILNVATLLKYWAFWAGMAMSVLALPVAFIAVRAIPGRWRNG